LILVTTLCIFIQQIWADRIKEIHLHGFKKIRYYNIFPLITKFMVELSAGYENQWETIF
jgi:hypothetical protein